MNNNPIVNVLPLQHTIPTDGSDPSPLCISLEQVYGVQYEHKGARGGLRKIVFTAIGPFVYLRPAGQWHPTEFEDGDS
jgi:hypothetical protein